MPPRLVVVVLRVVKRHCGDWVHFRTQQSQKINLALRLRVRHVDDKLIPLGPADVGESNTRVARCSFNDGAAGL
jgi:hypothetical protein